MNILNAKSLRFLSLNGLYKALLDEQRNNNYPQFSDHYFTGDYPIKPMIILKELKLNNYPCLVENQIINLQ